MNGHGGESCQDCTSQNMQCHSLAVGHRQTYDETAFHKMGNISLAVSHSKRCDEIALHNMCNVTHKLLGLGKGVMRYHFTKGAMSLAFCWS